MSWFNPKPKKTPEEIQVHQLRFLSEQDGQSERELKNRLVDFLRPDGSVNAAYLVRVAYGEGSVAVALCLRSHFEPDHALAQTIGNIFASMFGGHEHLDIIFLSEAQEAEVMTMCKPFFVLERPHER